MGGEPIDLATHMRVAVLVQRCQNEGGGAYIVARGDPVAGALLIKHAHADRTASVLQRRYDLQGVLVWDHAHSDGPVPESEADAYLERRRRSDPDIWIVEVETGFRPLDLSDI